MAGGLSSKGLLMSLPERPFCKPAEGFMELKHIVQRDQIAIGFTQSFLSW